MSRLELLVAAAIGAAWGAVLVKLLRDADRRSWRMSPEAGFLRYRRDALLAAEARE